MKLIIVVATVIAWAGIAWATSPTQVTTVGFQPYQRWLDEAKVPGPGPEVRVYESIAGCSDGGYACTWTDRDPPEVWINGGLPRELRRAIYLHEVGHIAHDRLTPEEQDRFAQIDGEAFNLEHFADAYMYCALGERRWGRGLPGPFPQWQPTKAQHRAACELIR